MSLVNLVVVKCTSLLATLEVEGIYIYIESVPLPVTDSKQLSLVLNKAFTSNYQDIPYYIYYWHLQDCRLGICLEHWKTPNQKRPKRCQRGALGNSGKAGEEIAGGRAHSASEVGHKSERSWREAQLRCITSRISQNSVPIDWVCAVGRSQQADQRGSQCRVFVCTSRSRPGPLR